MDAPTCITTKLDEVDKFWEMGLDDYEDDEDDDKESSIDDETDHGDKGLACKGGSIDKANLVTDVSIKPSFLEHVNVNSTIPSFLNPQSTCDLNSMLNNFVNSQLQSQLPSMPMNNMASSLGNICLGLQGNLVKFPNLTTGAWNLLQQLKAM
jgi:hypothetical protein